MTITLVIVAGAGALGGLLGWLATRGAHWQWRAMSAVLAWALAMAGAAAVAPSEADAELARAVPTFLQEDGYESSDTCRSCHPGQYESWHDSFHRTMTQVATPAAVAAPFDGRILFERGRAFAPVRDGDRYYIVEVAPERRAPLAVDGRWWEGQTSVSRVVLTTGSHHLQGYWVEAASGELEQVPFVYLIREGRWMANSDSFLQPPTPEEEALRRFVWVDECAVCHSTGGPFEPTEERPGPAVTELGIACEACHGPAETHAAANRSPVRRYGLHAQAEGDPTIANPRRLDRDRSSSVCARCHAIHPDDDPGPGLDLFLPGDRLADFIDVSSVFGVVERARAQGDTSGFTEEQREDISAFWDDGTVRVAGREYSGMIRSGCYLEGEMACTSCHSLHRGDRERQIDPDVAGDAMCGACHAEIGAAPPAHTHHDIASPGSRCVNCHMPYVSYGLMSSTRSHRVDGPTASGTTSRARPNACNLCHLDQTLGWTADRLTEWYGQPRRPLSEVHERDPAGAVWMLGGDAAQRGVVAWHAAYPPAGQASDLDVVRPALAWLMEDPYSAVRQLAGRAVLDLDPEAPVDMDALTRDPSPELREALWARYPPTDRLPGPRVLELVRTRDDTPTWVSE